MQHRISTINGQLGRDLFLSLFVSLSLFHESIYLHKFCGASVQNLANFFGLTKHGLDFFLVAEHGDGGRLRKFELVLQRVLASLHMRECFRDRRLVCTLSLLRRLVPLAVQIHFSFLDF